MQRETTPIAFPPLIRDRFSVVTPTTVKDGVPRESAVDFRALRPSSVSTHVASSTTEPVESSGARVLSSTQEPVESVSPQTLQHASVLRTNPDDDPLDPYRHNPEPSNETIDPLDNRAARPLDPTVIARLGERETFRRLIQDHPIGMPAIADSDYGQFGGMAAELTARNELKRDFLIRGIGKFADIYAGLVGRQIHLMFERPAASVPPGFELPRTDVRMGQGSDHFFANRDSIPVNVDYFGRLATAANLQNQPWFWEKPELILQSKVRSAVEIAVFEIKAFFGTLRNISPARSLENVKSYRDFFLCDSIIPLFARFASGFENIAARDTLQRAGFARDNITFLQKQYGGSAELLMVTPLLHQFADFQWDGEKIVPIPRKRARRL